MAKAGRISLAVIAGAAVWAVLWITGTRLTQAMFPELAAANQPLTHSGILILYIVYGAVLLSLLAGFTTAAIAGKHVSPAVGILAALQLAFGIIAEVSYWSLAPVWYHLVFLALIVPVTVYGGKLRVRQSGPAASLARA
jgi:hypothetical protein